MHPLQQRVRRIALMAKRLRWQLALGWLVAAGLLCLLVWGFVDSLLHVQEAGVRVIASAAILGIVGAVAWRLVRPTAKHSAGELVVAQHIERHFPALGDRLSSSLAFLTQDETDKTAGSASLRRAVIADTMARTDNLDFGAVIDARPARRALIAAVSLLVIAGIITAISPSSTTLVLTRTFWPWTTAAWPRRHQLAFEKTPDKLALGADFDVAVIDENGKLPDSVTLLYWFDGEREDQAQAREMKLLGGKMVHRLENVTRPFKYKAIGGDDQAMPWTQLVVLEPPRIAVLDVTIHPPSYTGWPTEQGAADFRALEGSRIQLAGQVDKPIKAAELKVEGSTTPIDVPIAVAADGLSLTLPAQADQPWLLTPSNAYTLKLTSTAGLTSQDAHHEIRVVPDRPPVVAIEKPADNTLATPQAILPVRVLAKDDLALHRIELRYSRSDNSELGEQSIELFAGPEQVAAVAKSPLTEGTLAGDSRVVEFAWEMANVPDLAPGITLTWHVAALDYKPQTGLSPTQRLMIISPEELEDRIAQRQAAILAQLHEVLRLQRDARSQVAALETQLQTVGRLAKQDLDDLLSAELNQRQVQRSIGSETDGLLTQIALLLAELENNRLDSPDVSRRMTGLASELKRLAKDPLAVVERDLTAAQKLVREDIDKRGDLPPDAPTPEPDTQARASTEKALTSVGQQQDVVVASLERMLGDLSEWDNYRRFAREMSRLRGDREALRKETLALQPLTLSKSPRDLNPQEQASLRRLAQRQTELSRQFDKLLGRMTDARGKIAESQPLAAETLADALDAAKRLGISSQMLDAARGIDRNQLGNAGEGQEEVTTALNEMLDILSNRKEHELGRRVKQLREAVTELGGLEEQLKGLRARTEQAGKVGNETERKRQLERLTKEHERLAEEVQRLARRLERLQAEKAGASASQASDKIGQAGEASKQDAAAKALEDNVQAQTKLAEAKQQLQQDLAQAQQDLFFEQVAKLEQAIQGLVQRQTAVVAETERLEGLKTNQAGEWTPSQRTSVRSLTEQQRDLVGETTTYAQKLAQAEAFGLALQGAVREMGRAAARLDRFQTDAETQNSEKIALARLSQLLEALKPEEPTSEQQAPMPGDGGGENQQQPPPGDALTLLSELKLLKLMQAEINRRTTELEKGRAGVANLPPEQEQELADLATEQGQLADLVQNIVAKAREPQKNQPLVPENPGEDEQPPPGKKDPLDEELNKALDNELLPGNK